ncbi:MAG: DUF4403 family protein [Bacteroidetes bacterium]|nr:DUF4403 family protein [Bacteroidota bacterium]
MKSVLIFWIGVGGLLAVSCKSLDPAASLPLPAVPKTTSSVNVPLEIPFSTLTAVANRETPSLIFRQRGMDLGNGLVGDFDFSRNGKIQLRALDQQRLEVMFPLKIQGEVGLKPGGIRNLLQSNVPINQSLAPVFVINPEVQSNWYLGISEFELMDLGGKMALSVLGIELDLSPLVRQEIRLFAKQELTSKPNLLALKPLMESIWNQVGKPILVEVEGKKTGLSIRPDSVKIREYLQPNKGLHLDLGFQGQVELHPSTAVPSRAFPLPKISPNTDGYNRIDLELPLAFTYAELDALIQKSFGGQALRMNKSYVFQANQFRTQAYGDRLGVTVAFTAISNKGGELKGELFLAGHPVYDPVTKVLRVENLDFIMKSGGMKAMLGTLIKRGKIHKQLSQQMKMPLGETIAESLKGLQGLLSLQTPVANLSIQGLQVVPLGFYPTTTGLAIPLKATATTAIQWK